MLLFIRYERFMPLVFTLVFHIGLGLCFLLTKSENISLSPQSLRVNLVAPSINTSSKKANTPTDAKLKNLGIRAVDGGGEGKDSASVKQETNGKQSPDSVELNSAVTEPVFNASYLNNPPPVYPPSAKRDGIQGRVILLVEVRADGLAKNVYIHESSGYSALDNAAKRAVISWKFIPAKQYGKSIDASVLVPIEFKLT